MKRYGLLLGSLLLLAGTLAAQEMNFTVKVNYQKRQQVDISVYQTLEQTLAEFVNNTKWTDDFFEAGERIRGNILLTIQEELSPNTFRADLAIQSSRPVYGSNYETPMLNHIDKEVTFTYEQFQPLIFSRNSFNDNLSAILSFYMYVVLGLDYDSFSAYGGEPYFQIAQEILNNIPSSVANSLKGWRSIDGNRNRFWIIENILSPRVRPYRQSMYEYHRHGLDLMSQDPAAGRAVIMTALESLLKVNQDYPNAMILQMFTNAKRDEIVEIFKQGSTQEKNTVVNAMSRIDAPNAAAYRSVR